MRTEVKIGIVVGLIVIATGVIFFVSQGRKSGGKVADSVPMDAPASKVASGTPAPGKTETPAKKPADTRQTPPLKTASPTTPPPAAPKTAAGTPVKPPETAPPTGGGTPPLAAKPPAPAPPKTATGEPANPLSGGATTPPATTPPTTLIDRSLPTRPAPATSTPALPPLAPGESTRMGGGTAEPISRPNEGLTGETPAPKPAPVLLPVTKREPEPTSATPSTPTPAGKSPAAATSKHTVKKSETLWAIAEEAYGDGNLWTKIKAANPGLSENLKVGQVINVPSKEEATGASAPSKPGETPKPGTPAAKPDAAAKPGDAKTAAPPGTYKVQENDTLYGIAQKALGNGGLWKKIYELNKDKLAKPEDLEVGMELRLPAKEGETTKPANGKTEAKKTETSKTETGKKPAAGKGEKKPESDKKPENGKTDSKKPDAKKGEADKGAADKKR